MRKPPSVYNSVSASRKFSDSTLFALPSLERQNREVYQVSTPKKNINSKIPSIQVRSSSRGREKEQIETKPKLSRYEEINNVEYENLLSELEKETNLISPITLQSKIPPTVRSEDPWRIDAEFSPAGIRNENLNQDANMTQYIVFTKDCMVNTKASFISNSTYDINAMVNDTEDVPVCQDLKKDAEIKNEDIVSDSVQLSEVEEILNSTNKAEDLVLEEESNVLLQETILLKKIESPSSNTSSDTKCNSEGGNGPSDSDSFTQPKA